MDYLGFIKNANSNELDELKKAFEVKEKADKVWKGILKTKLNLNENLINKGYSTLWKDEHNQELIKIYISDNKIKFKWVAEYLHQFYQFDLNYEVIFNAIRRNDGGINYLVSCFESRADNK